MANVREIQDIDYFNDFPYEAVVDFAHKHGRRSLLDASDEICRGEIAHERALLQTKTLADLLRYINEAAVVRDDRASYLYDDRIGDASHRGDYPRYGLVCSQSAPFRKLRAFDS